MNNHKFVMAFIISLICGLLSVYIDKICPFRIIMPFPVIFIGGIGVFCIVNFIRYSRKPTAEVLLYSLAGFLVSSFIIVVAYILSSLSKLEAAVFINMIEFKLNYITLILSLSAGLTVADLLNLKKQQESHFQETKSIKLPEIKLKDDNKDEVIKITEFIPNSKASTKKTDDIIPEINDFFDKIESKHPEPKPQKEEVIKITESIPNSKISTKKTEEIIPEINDFFEKIENRHPEPKLEKDEYQDDVIKITEFIPNSKTSTKKTEEIISEINDFFEKIESRHPEPKPKKDEYKDEVIKITEFIPNSRASTKKTEDVIPQSTPEQTEDELKKEKELNSFFEEDYELKTNNAENKVIFEFIDDKKIETLFVQEWENEKKETVNSIELDTELNMFEENLGDLPEIKLEENQISIKKQLKFGIEEVKELTPYQFIPENLRLANNKAERKEEKEGKITAIGKLIVNERDIENIIELGSLGQAGGFRAKIVTVESGGKSTEIFSKINEICPQIKTISFIDKSGFILKSSIGDNHREQTIGAVAAHAFMTLQNYASQIAFTDVDNIIFNTKTSSLMLKSVEDKIYALEFIEKSNNFKTTALAEILTSSNFNNHNDILLLKSNEDVIASIFVDVLGTCKEENTELKKLASISSSIFENLRIFLVNIQTQPLDSLVLFEKDKALVIKKSDEQLAVFIVNGQSLICLEETIEKVLTVLNKGI